MNNYQKSIHKIGILFKFEGSVGGAGNGLFAGLLMVSMQTNYAPTGLTLTFGEDAAKSYSRERRHVYKQRHCLR